jgi:hypothetical protein
MSTNAITLIHNQTIRIASFDRYAKRIRVGTVEGCAKDKGEDPAAEAARAKSLGHELAWTCQAPAVLTADYPGKNERIYAERGEIAAAQVIEDGDDVIIEGRHYTVRVLGQCYSDPVAFMPRTEAA